MDESPEVDVGRSGLILALILTCMGAVLACWRSERWVGRRLSWSEIALSTNGRTHVDQTGTTEQTRHEVTAPRAVGSSGGIVSVPSVLDYPLHMSYGWTRMAPWAVLSLVLCVSASAQQAQNPSPMVEHTREHPRLTETSPPGRREKLELGTLFLPEKLKAKSGMKLLFFFHGGDWVPEVAAARQRNMAVISVQAGAGSGTYTKLFEDPARFAKVVAEAQVKSGVTFSEVDLGGWSAGCGALRQILSDAASYDRVQRVLCIDGVHAGYVNGTPGPLESAIVPENLASWLRFGRDAISGKKRLIITHSEIFPGTFASTTETTDFLLHAWRLQPHPVVRWGPRRTQMLSELKAGGLTVVGFAGNSAPDHVDQLHSLPEYLSWLLKK